MSKLLYTRFTKLIIDYFLTCNKNIPRISNSKIHSEGDDLPITKLSNTLKGTYKFGMEIPDIMVNEAFKKSAGYKYYKAKKVESEKVKAAEEPEEKNVSLVRSGKGKGYMCSSDYEANVPKVFRKDVVPRKTRSLTIAEETIVVELAKSISIDEQRTQQRRRSQLTIEAHNENDKGSKASRLESLKQKKQAVAGEGSSAAHTKYYDTSDTESDATHYSSCSDTSEESANETDDADDYDMDLYNDNPDGDDAAAGFGSLLDETPINKLTDLMSNPVYTDAHTTSAVHNLEGNPEVRSFLSGASEVPFAKAKKLMQKAKRNMRKINFKKAVAHKFREYDQKLEGLTNFNVSKAFEKVIQAKFLTEIKKLLLTHIPTVVANYVKPRLKTSVLEVMKNNQN
ncbi:hypothetical protein Tco_1277937 [Tanacetum coccineum]